MCEVPAPTSRSIRLQQRATLPVPVVLQTQDRFLKGDHGEASARMMARRSRDSTEHCGRRPARATAAANSRTMTLIASAGSIAVADIRSPPLWPCTVPSSAPAVLNGKLRRRPCPARRRWPSRRCWSPAASGAASRASACARSAGAAAARSSPRTTRGCERLSIIVGARRRIAPGAPDHVRRTGLRSRCSPRCAARRSPSAAGRRAPRSWSPIGICIRSTNQRNPRGMNSPNGTRCCLL